MLFNYEGINYQLQLCHGTTYPKRDWL